MLTCCCFVVRKKQKETHQSKNRRTAMAIPHTTDGLNVSAWHVPLRMVYATCKMLPIHSIQPCVLNNPQGGILVGMPIYYIFRVYSTVCRESSVLGLASQAESMPCRGSRDGHQLFSAAWVSFFLWSWRQPCWMVLKEPFKESCFAILNVP